MSISSEHDKGLGRIVRNVGAFLLVTKSQIRRQKNHKISYQYSKIRVHMETLCTVMH
jgi:hypothetical protein